LLCPVFLSSLLFTHDTSDSHDLRAQNHGSFLTGGVIAPSRAAQKSSPGAHDLFAWFLLKTRTGTRRFKVRGLWNATPAGFRLERQYVHDRHDHHYMMCRWNISGRRIPEE
ncbi:MAG: hypothetical protein QME27_09605, partial [Syntrophaceae bacterium]|nr:hypothetical protein [Syntrophaceae bacterium]